MKKALLVIIFNHRYDRNIEKLKRLYQDRFSRICFLVPFYDGACEEVIPVYESSYQFPGFLIQAYEKLVKENADYYFFISDDLILSPDINEDNVLDKLKMQDRSLYLDYIIPLNSTGNFGWHHARFSSVPFLNKMTKWEDSLPGYETALKKFYAFFGEAYKETYGDAFFQTDSEIREDEVSAFVQRNENTLKIPYPMARGYSDVFMIKAEQLFSIARLCGIFSAMNMFAEISFPTAVVLSVPRDEVVTIEETKYSRRCGWTAEERNLIEEEYHKEVRALYERWNHENLYIHPVKLSQWEMP